MQKSLPERVQNTQEQSFFWLKSFKPLKGLWDCFMEFTQKSIMQTEMDVSALSLSISLSIIIFSFFSFLSSPSLFHEQNLPIAISLFV